MHTIPAQKVFLALCLTFFALDAIAVPSLRDHWQFFCTTNKVTKKTVARAREKSETSVGLKAGMATFNYACLLSIYEYESFRSKFTKWQEGGGQGQRPTLVNNASNTQIKRALLDLKSAYRNNKKNPKVLFYYGYLLALAGDALAVNVFDELQTKFKSSPLTSESFLVLGEFYFDNGAIDKAKREYRNALRSKRKVVKNYTRYKLAWMKFANANSKKNKGLQRQAIADMAKLTRALARSRDRFAKKLVKRIKSDLLELLVALNNVAEARRTLSSVGAKDVFADFLELMADARIEAGDARGAYKLLNLAIKENPYGVKVLLFRTNMINLAAQTDNIKLLVSELKAMVATFVSSKSPWRKKQKKATIKAAKRQTENLLFEWATTLDSQGRQQNNKAYLSGALKAYPLFLKNFPKSKNFSDAQSFYGQLLFQQKYYLPAAKLFIKLIKDNPKSKKTRENLELAVTAAQSAIDLDKTNYNLPEAGTAESKIKLPAVKQIYVDSLDLFVKYMRSNENVPAMRYAAASVLYDFGHYEDATARFFKIVKDYPDSDDAVRSAYNILTYSKKWRGKSGLAEDVKKLSKYQRIKNTQELAPFFAAEKKSKPKAKNAVDAEP